MQNGYIHKTYYAASKHRAQLFFNMLYIPTEDNYKNASKEYNVTLKNRLLQYILLLRESFFGNGIQKINLPRKKEKNILKHNF